MESVGEQGLVQPARRAVIGWLASDGAEHLALQKLLLLLLALRACHGVGRQLGHSPTRVAVLVARLALAALEVFAGAIVQAAQELLEKVSGGQHALRGRRLGGPFAGARAWGFRGTAARHPDGAGAAGELGAQDASASYLK